MQVLSIGKAAREAGVGVETVRFYERRGMIVQPPKPAGSGFREYSAETVRRIQFIRQAQKLGFSLSEIKELLSLRAEPAADCGEVRAQVTAKVEEVNQKIGELKQIRTALEEVIASCPGSGELKTCTILHALENGTIPQPQKAVAAQHEGASEMKSLTLKVEGMHCNGCAQTVKALVGSEPGVRTAEVSYQDRQARVLYDPQATSEDRLIEVIEKGGYHVQTAAG